MTSSIKYLIISSLPDITGYVKRGHFRLSLAKGLALASSMKNFTILINPHSAAMKRGAKPKCEGSLGSRWTSLTKYFTISILSSDENDLISRLYPFLNCLCGFTLKISINYFTNIISPRVQPSERSSMASIPDIFIFLKNRRFFLLNLLKFYFVNSIYIYSKNNSIIIFFNE